MNKRFPVFTVVSALCFAITVVFVTASFVIDPWKHSISCGDGFHVKLLHPIDNPSVVFFSDRDCGPYRGSIIGVVGPDGFVAPQLAREIHFGSIAGVYLRSFEWGPNDVLWTLMVSLFYPLVLFALLPVTWLSDQFVRWSQKQNKSGRCIQASC